MHLVSGTFTNGGLSQSSRVYNSQVSQQQAETDVEERNQDVSGQEKGVLFSELCGRGFISL